MNRSKNLKNRLDFDPSSDIKPEKADDSNDYMDNIEEDGMIYFDQ